MEKSEIIDAALKRKVGLDGMMLTLAIGVLSSAISWATVHLIGAEAENGVQSKAIEDSEACRTKLMELRNREQDCRSDMAKSEIEDLRQRLMELERRK